MLTDAIQICNNIQTITFSSDGNPLDFQHDIKTSLTSSSWFPIDIYLACPVDYVIYEYLPQLQCLELSRNYWDKDQFSITYSRSQDEYSTMTGMKSLLLNLYDCLDPTNFDRLYALILKRSYYTLEYLEIHYDNILSTQKTFAVLAELGAPNLQVLYLTPFLGTVTPSPRVLSQLLLACPALQTVHFGGSDYVWSDHLYEALGKLPMLTYLSLPLGNVDPRDDMKEDHSSSDTAELESPAPNLDKIYKSATPSGALALFEQTKSLWSLYINYSYLYPVDQLTMNVLTCIGTCISLRKLDISAVIFNNEQLMTFLDSMKYSNIHTLEIHSPTRPVHEKELKALASLPRVEVLKIFDYGKSLGKGFDKPRLFRLFQEHQMDRPFIVYIYGLLAMNGWKQPTSSSVSSIDNNKIKCLHKLYSIQEPESNYDNNIDDDDNYDRDDSNTNPENHDTNSPHGDRILYNGVFCIECGCDHGLQTGYNYVNEVYKDSPNL
ncbi:hypothetical protein BDA99DRAFT_103020 [Phascolomyces articulosus]|uniref:F-box domain-containing protein n=1 Tax=Phascolomyces articulosus TaxID=60185 RepID=A0AAD5K6Y1_9FUNG|nr:hypothetical protein BDA99DRAFT_103020 [Phascolomyces articulosus]